MSDSSKCQCIAESTGKQCGRVRPKGGDYCHQHSKICKKSVAKQSIERSHPSQPSFSSSPRPRDRLSGLPIELQGMILAGLSSPKDVANAAIAMGKRTASNEGVKELYIKREYEEEMRTSNNIKELGYLVDAYNKSYKIPEREEFNERMYVSPMRELLEGPLNIKSEYGVEVINNFLDSSYVKHGLTSMLLDRDDVLCEYFDKTKVFRMIFEFGHVNKIAAHPKLECYINISPYDTSDNIFYYIANDLDRTIKIFEIIINRPDFKLDPIKDFIDNPRFEMPLYKKTKFMAVINSWMKNKRK